MSTADVSDWPTSALRAADLTFTLLTGDPDPLSLDCDSLGTDLGLPSGAVALPVLRDWLLAHPRHYPARDAVWRELIRRARLDGPQWVIAAVGMAMPALVRLAGQLTAGYRGDPADLDAEILTGFLEALRDRVDLAAPAPYASLCFAAYRAGRADRLDHATYLPVDDIETTAAQPRSPKLPYGHPDLLVTRAVALRLIDPDDADAFIEVRLGRRAIEPIAAARGITVDALRMRLGRADTRLAQALASGLLTGVVSPEAAKDLDTRAERQAKIRTGKAAERHPRHTPAAAGPGVYATAA
jgi:DNA-directed RNA polymerase specialized sigma24 family protein